MRVENAENDGTAGAAIEEGVEVLAGAKVFDDLGETEAKSFLDVL